MPSSNLGRVFSTWRGIAVLAAILIIKPTQATAQTILWGHVPTAAIASSHALGRSDSAQTIDLALTLPVHDAQSLDSLIHRLYDPSDPSYGKYLSPEEFTARFSPNQAEYDAVKAFAREQGLTITGTFSNRLVLDVRGTGAQIEKAFGTRLYQFQGADGRVFRAPDTEPRVPAAVAGAISGIAGLDDLAVFKPKNHLAEQGGIVPHAGPGGGLTPSEIKTAYNLNGSLPTGPMPTGAGQTMAVFELDGYKASDIAQYETSYGLPSVPLQNVLVDGASGVSSGAGGAAEVTLDIELQIALAPGAAKVMVYEAPNSGAGVVDTYHRIASDNIAKNISTSWGLAELISGTSLRNSENAAFQQMAAQGQSIYAAAGDSGADDDGSTLSVDDPASQPFMTGVGGTRLGTKADHSYLSETTWNHGSAAGGAGGGGVSALWSKPGYQAGVGFSSTMRNVPDVSLDADPSTGYSVYFNGHWTAYGGTSCAAPLWAAFTALVNQQRQANGLAYLGFSNPVLYAIGNNPAQYAADFHDIADNSTNLFYHAIPGFDDATGWGTFNGANLLMDLAPSNGPDFSILAAPGSVSVVQGASSQAALTIASLNGFSGSVTLSASGLPSFVSAAFDANLVSDTATVTIAAGNGTPAGSYTVTITGTSGGRTHATTIGLTVTSNGLDAPPTVAAAASAASNPVAATSTGLSVLGADDGGEAALTYTWATAAKPAGLAAPLFSANGTNAAKNTTVTFKGTGAYTFTVTIQEPSGLTVTSSVNVTVNQTLSFLSVTPASVTLSPAGIQQFTALAKDLFGITMTVQPAFTWTATGGTVSNIGLYIAGQANGTFQVTATASGKTAKATVTIAGAVQVLTSITVGPSSTTLSAESVQQFTATAFDQNNNPMSPQPAFTWSVSGGGGIDATGLFSANAPGGPFTVTAASGDILGSASVTVTPAGSDTPPTVATAAHAPTATVTGSNTTLSVLGADDGGEAPLTYTWAATAMPAGAASPTFSVNGTNTAKNTTATFKKAGDYTFTVTIREPSGLACTSNMSVTVQQTMSFISVAPGSMTVPHGTAQQFTATAKDLFANVMTVQPAITWTATGGTVTGGGLYTAGASIGAFAVTAAASGKSGKVTVTVN